VLEVALKRSRGKGTEGCVAEQRGESRERLRAQGRGRALEPPFREELRGAQRAEAALLEADRVDAEDRELLVLGADRTPESRDGSTAVSGGSPGPPPIAIRKAVGGSALDGRYARGEGGFDARRVDELVGEPQESGRIGGDDQRIGLARIDSARRAKERRDAPLREGARKRPGEARVEGKSARLEGDEPEQRRRWSEVGERREPERLQGRWRGFGRRFGASAADRRAGESQDRHERCEPRWAGETHRQPSQRETVMYANLRFFEPTRTR
jgi:hypothetical protein